MKFNNLSAALKLIKQLQSKTWSIISKEDRVKYSRAIDELEEFINYSENEEYAKTFNEDI
jgi:hypothetical protein